MAKQKVLLVDSIPITLEMQKNFLYNCPVRVLTARSGEEALEVSRRERPGLIYLDLHLPEMDGAACCAIIKDDPVLRSVPVIMLTTDWSVEAKTRCLDAGCDEFLLMPLKRHQFLEKGQRFIPGLGRRDLRVSCHVPVNMRRNGLDIDATGADISAGGIYVASEEGVRQDENVNITFSLPAQGSHEIAAQGRVAWRNAGSTPSKPLLPPGFGVEFTSIDEDDAEAIRRYVDAASST